MVKISEMFNTIFREKPALMLVNLYKSKNEVYASSLAKEIDCTYSHVIKLLQQMEKANLLNCDKQGRLKLLRLTKKGNDIAEYIEKLANLL